MNNRPNKEDQSLVNKLQEEDPLLAENLLTKLREDRESLSLNNLLRWSNAGDLT